jgi:DNA-binding transcriptional LysR family regulator
MSEDAPKKVTFSDVMLRRLKFRPLLIFDRVFQRRSILHAAHELHLTQSAVTKAVRELEDDLGVQLFQRTNRGVEPTAYGLLLGARVKLVIAEVRYLADELNAFRSAETGHVIVGTLIAGSARLLPLAIAELKRRAPGVLVTVREGVADSLYPALATGELDLVVGRLPGRDHPIARSFPLEHERLFNESFCLVVRRDHRMTAMSPPTLADTLDSLWILPVPESPARLVVEDLFANAGLDLPSRRIESMSLFTNLGLIMHADACCLMPRGAFELLNAGGQIAEVPISGVDRFGDVGLSVRSGHPLSPAAHLLTETLRTVAATLS